MPRSAAIWRGSIDGQAVPGYADELGQASDTETFVALRCHVDTWPGQACPFYLRTGKRLGQRSSEIVVTFKPVPHSIFGGVATDALTPKPAGAAVAAQ